MDWEKRFYSGFLIERFMQDLFFVSLTVGFFVLMLIFIWACEKV
jgi:hypothetical protein